MWASRVNDAAGGRQGKQGRERGGGAACLAACKSAVLPAQQCGTVSTSIIGGESDRSSIELQPSDGSNTPRLGCPILRLAKRANMSLLVTGLVCPPPSALDLGLSVVSRTECKAGGESGACSLTRSLLPAGPTRRTARRRPRGPAAAKTCNSERQCKGPSGDNGCSTGRKKQSNAMSAP
jgi:hypothetical protein